MLDKELLVFPLLSIAALGLTLVAGVLPAYLSGNLEPFLLWFSDDPDGASTYAMVAVSYVSYIFTTFVFIFFNTALIACARIRFAGGDPTVADGLKAATSLLPLVFVWAVVTGTVGFILKKASEKNDGIGGIIFGMLGVAWTIAAYFVVPVLVAERVGPIKAMKSSAALIRKTWGEAMIAELGLSAVAIAVVVPVFVLGSIAAMLFEAVPVISITLAVFLVTVLLLTGLILSTLDAILKSALYVYAVDGKMPDHFDGVDFEHAFRAADPRDKSKTPSNRKYDDDHSFDSDPSD
jgi:hypothetical protein